MYFNDTEIRRELLENWRELSESAYPEDLLTRWAGEAVPVYYGEIIADWWEMPNEFTDSWEEFGLPQEVTITGLMSMDVFNYYQSRFNAIYNEIKEELEESELENA
jgi:hypothetical protein